MKEDFHYFAIRVLAEKAGFAPREAQTIAYASQYVDDATEHKKIIVKSLPDEIREAYAARITKGKYFDPVCTAHEGLDYILGLKEDAQKRVYISFHFVPGERSVVNESYNYRAVRNGTLARQLISDAIAALQSAISRHKRQHFIRLGITLHSYADTWAHEQFSGRNSATDNAVKGIEILKGRRWLSAASQPELLLETAVASLAPEIGHAKALSFPDQSHIQWRYSTPADDAAVRRNNTQIFLEAAQSIFGHLRSITGAGVAWETFGDVLKECFATPTASAQAALDLYSRAFPSMRFAYDREHWRRQSLKGVAFDWDRFWSAEDFLASSYEFNGDKKWFYFHIEAFRQRQFLMSCLPGES